MWLKFQEITLIDLWKVIIFEKICFFDVARLQEQKLSNRPEIWHRCSFYISSDQVRCPKKSVHYEKRYLGLKIKKKN